MSLQDHVSIQFGRTHETDGEIWIFSHIVIIIDRSKNNNSNILDYGNHAVKSMTVNTNS